MYFFCRLLLISWYIFSVDVDACYVAAKDTLLCIGIKG
jgi:hypothetical protein